MSNEAALLRVIAVAISAAVTTANAGLGVLWARGGGHKWAISHFAAATVGLATTIAWTVQ